MAVERGLGFRRKKKLGLPKKKASVKIPDNKAERLNLGIRVTWAWFERVNLCNKQIIKVE
jgi:hypothetical protein